MYAVCCRKYLTLKVIESDSRRSYIEGDIWTIRLCYKVWTPARHTIGTFYCTLSNFSCIHPADTIAADSESCVIRLLGGVSNTGWLYLDRNLRRLEVCPLLSISIRFILVTIYFDWLLLTTCTLSNVRERVLFSLWLLELLQPKWLFTCLLLVWTNMCCTCYPFRFLLY